MVYGHGSERSLRVVYRHVDHGGGLDVNHLSQDAGKLTRIGRPESSRAERLGEPDQVWIPELRFESSARLRELLDPNAS